MIINLKHSIPLDTILYHTSSCDLRKHKLELFKNRSRLNGAKYLSRDSTAMPTRDVDTALYTKCCQAKYLAIWPTMFISPQKVLLAPSGLFRRESAVTRVHSRFGDRCFAAAGPVLRIWNNLPASLRDKEVSCTEYRKQLKTFTFQTDCGAS